MEELDPSISGFVQSALRQQKPTFTSIIQEAELVHTSVRAAERKAIEQNVNEASCSSRPSVLVNTARSRADYTHNTRSGKIHPVLSAEETIMDAPARLPSVETEILQTGPPVSATDDGNESMEHALVAHLAAPQKVRYCYKCWRPGHFSAECP
jgi:hypothetical protein